MSRDELVRIRLSAPEKQIFTRQAEQAGVSLSAWMRLTLRRVAGENGAVFPTRKVPPAKKKAR